MRFACASALLLFAAGCGRIEYGHSQRRAVAVQQPSAGAVAVQAPPARQPGGVVYVPWDPGARPGAPPPQIAAAPSSGAVHCGGRQRVRIDAEVLDGQNGPAIVATGRCRIVVTRSVVRGHPAIVLQDRARVVVLRSRVSGDVQSSGRARIAMRHSRHQTGRVLRY